MMNEYDEFVNLLKRRLSGYSFDKLLYDELKEFLEDKGDNILEKAANQAYIELGLRRESHNDKSEVNREVPEVFRYFIQSDSRFEIFSVVGDSMVDARINEGDFLLVKKCDKPINNKIMILELNERLFVKRISIVEDNINLISENKSYPVYSVSRFDKFKIIGRVEYILSKINN